MPNVPVVVHEHLTGGDDAVIGWLCGAGVPAAAFVSDQKGPHIRVVWICPGRAEVRSRVEDEVVAQRAGFLRNLMS